VRALARSKAESKEILAACDRVRDSTLVELGVRLEDKPDGGWGTLVPA
jgi:cysteinyl-tRNA synthetase